MRWITKLLLVLGLSGLLRADLPTEHLLVPPDRVAPSVRRDAIGVWMHNCTIHRYTSGQPTPVKGIPIYTRRGPNRWEPAGTYPLDRVKTISVYGYVVDPRCLDFTLYRFVVTRREGHHMEVVVDVEKDRRVWVHVPPPPDTDRWFADRVVWLDRFGKDAIYANIQFLPGFFTAEPVFYAAPSWSARRIQLPPDIGYRWMDQSCMPLSCDTTRLPVWFTVVTDGRAGDFLRVTHTAGPFETAPLDIPEIPGDSDTVWVPLRDKQGRLMIWFVDQSD